MSHINDPAVLRGAIWVGNRLVVHRRPGQLFAGSALYQQWNEFPQLAVVEPRVDVLDDTGNVIMR